MPTTLPTEDLVAAFLERFAAGSDSLDPDLVGRCYQQVFLAADADASRVVPREAFLAALPRRRETFAAAGIGPATLRSWTHQDLDAHHLLVRTEWQAPRLDGTGSIPLSSSFLLRRDGDELQIMVYLNHRGLTG